MVGFVSIVIIIIIFKIGWPRSFFVPLSSPDRSVHNFRASKSIDRRLFDGNCEIFGQVFLSVCSECCIVWFFCICVDLHRLYEETGSGSGSTMVSPQSPPPPFFCYFSLCLHFFLQFDCLQLLVTKCPIEIEHSDRAAAPNNVCVCVLCVRLVLILSATMYQRQILHYRALTFHWEQINRPPLLLLFSHKYNRERTKKTAVWSNIIATQLDLFGASKSFAQLLKIRRSPDLETLILGKRRSGSWFLLFSSLSKQSLLTF